MTTILTLLALLGGAIVIIAIGTRISLYFYMQNALETHQLSAQNQAGQVDSTMVERSSTGQLMETESVSARYAWMGITITLGIIVVAILAAITMIGGVFN